MAVMELQSLSASPVPTALRSHVAQASGSRSAQVDMHRKSRRPLRV